MVTCRTGMFLRAEFQQRWDTFLAFFCFYYVIMCTTLIMCCTTLFGNVECVWALGEHPNALHDPGHSGTAVYVASHSAHGVLLLCIWWSGWWGERRRGGAGAWRWEAVVLGHLHFISNAYIRQVRFRDRIGRSVFSSAGCVCVLFFCTFHSFPGAKSRTTGWFELCFPVMCILLRGCCLGLWLLLLFLLVVLLSLVIMVVVVVLCRLFPSPLSPRLV